MIIVDSALDAAPMADALTRGIVVGGDSTSLIVLPHGGVAPIACDVLYGPHGAVALDTGDFVLLWVPREPQARGVVLGRLGPATGSAAPAPAPTLGGTDIPDELVLEAKEQLTLRVGDGSITLRADGKIQIRGKDLVSHAQRLNRIKGGAVSIN